MHVTPKKRGSMHQVRIQDGEELRRVLQVVYDRFGTHGRAATFLGIGQSTFTRLLNGKTFKAMTNDTYVSVRQALQKEPLEFGLLESFEDSVLAFEAQAVQRQYDRWLQQELERLRESAKPIVQQLFSHHRYQSVFHRFLERTRYRTELPAADDDRAWLALYRAVEPLCASKPTYGVERSWEELDSSRELKAYLQAALGREAIMLGRGRDIDRVREVELPEEWYRAMAEEVEPTPEDVEAEIAGWRKVGVELNLSEKPADSSHR
jgi:hypothetical protein